MPLNDPFGGWVAWTKIPRDGLRAELVPGGGATAWGNAALGGVVQLFSPEPQLNATAVVIGSGARDTRSLELSHCRGSGLEEFDFSGRIFSTAGFPLVAPERRGAIDIPAWSRHRWLSGRWKHSFSPSLMLTTSARIYEEFRGNGTPFTRNGTREKFASISLKGGPREDFLWRADGYVQDQSFASTFSSVNAARTAETPASDQFAVPATAFGAAWSGAWQHVGGSKSSAGADLRFTRGETRENFTFTAGNFTRRRIAGGEQTFGGLFALHERPLAPDLRATFGARLDRWRDTAGHRRETDRNTAAIFRDDHYAGQSGTEFSPSAGLVWRQTETWRLRANAQQSFRRPTLNELYRPFRQGANVTEANATLRTEHVRSGEAGVEWIPIFLSDQPAPLGVIQLSHFKPPPRKPLLTLSATAFWNDLRDAVGNVTLVRGPGTFPLFGAIAAGGFGRQKLNLDRLRVQGLELSAKWTPAPTVTFTAELLFNDATVRRATLAPALVGKRVAQVPRRNASLGATWRAPGGIVLTPRVRWIGRQFEDDENALILGECVVTDLGASRALTKHLELFLTCENLGATRLETGRSADGVVNIGTPRLFLAGLRGHW